MFEIPALDGYVV